MEPKDAARGEVLSFTIPPQGTAELTYPPEFDKLEPHEQDTIKAIFNEVRKGNAFPIVAGGFGDVKNCDGIVQLKIEPPEGGLMTKFWGCEYLFKGFPEKSVVEGLGLAKSMLSQLPRQLITKSKYWTIVLAFRMIFMKKYLIHDAKIWFGTIYGHTLLKLNFPESKYNRQVKELIRSGDEALKRMLDKLGKKGDIPYHWAYFNLLIHREYDKITEREIWEVVATALKFIFFFIEYDNAYRFRISDALKNLDKEAARKNVIKETKRLLDLMIERENPDFGIRYKWIGIRRLVIPAMYVSKQLREFIKEFLLELDINQIRPDEHDYYFQLRRDTYMFDGRPFEERAAEAEQIDRDKKITRCQLRMINDKGRQIPIIQVLKPPKINV